MMRIGAPLTSGECEEYLRILGVPGRDPSLSALSELVAAHLCRVPFENLSKLLRFRHSGLRGVPDFGVFLEGVAEHGFGGTCYSNNYHLNRLLVSLGYHAVLCGADMARPDVHLVNLVSLEGREYLVDAGYGGPFLAPLPRDLGGDHEILLGRERYVLKPQDRKGCSRLELHRDGRLRHGYLMKPGPRHIREFAGVIEGSFAPTATFMRSLAMVRFSERRSVALRNLTLTESEGSDYSIRRIADPAQLPAVIEAHFGIPVRISSEALSGLALDQDGWGEDCSDAVLEGGLSP